MSTRQTGNRCSRPLTVTILDGRSLSREDEVLLKVDFGEERVQGDISPGKYAVCLMFSSRLSHDPPALRCVGYGRLTCLQDVKEIEALAYQIGSEILGTPKTEIRVVGKPNGETWVVALCDLDDFSVKKKRTTY